MQKEVDDMPSSDASVTEEHCSSSSSSGSSSTPVPSRKKLKVDIALRQEVQLPRSVDGACKVGHASPQVW